MDEMEKKMYDGFIEYYEQYDIGELYILRKHLINRWNLIESSAQNLVREEFKLELQAIDASLRDLFVNELLADIRVEINGKGEA